jgi:hypothetical protein
MDRVSEESWVLRREEERDAGLEESKGERKEGRDKLGLDRQKWEKEQRRRVADPDQRDDLKGGLARLKDIERNGRTKGRSPSIRYPSGRLVSAAMQTCGRRSTGDPEGG